MKSLLFAVLLFPVAALAVAQTEEPVELKTADLTLSGTLSMPVNAKGPVPIVVIIAGSGPTDRNGNQQTSVKGNTYKMLADSLAARGIATLRYDKRGVGTSIQPGMTEKGLTFESYIRDAVGWLTQLRADKRFSKLIVAGHSEGSLIGMVATRQAKADAFISLAGPGDDINSKLKTQLGVQLPEPERAETFKALDSLKAGYTLGKSPTSYPAVQQLFRPSVQPYLISWMKYDPAAQLKLLTGPVLLIQGRHDIQITMADVDKLKMASPSAQIVVFDEMSHLLKNAPDDRMANFATYSQPDLPLTPGLANAIATFAKKIR